MTDLCLIAGQGRLPEILRSEYPEMRVTGPAGDAPEGAEVFRLEHLGSFLKGLHGDGVRRICLAGAIKRPVVDLSAIDDETQPLVPRIVAALGQGDDGALRVVVDLIGEFGMEVVGAPDLCPQLLPEVGFLGSKRPTERDEGDRERGLSVLSAMGGADVGQGCVVAGGQVLAVEALPGTDWMLTSVSAMRHAPAPQDKTRAMGGLRSQTLDALGLARPPAEPEVEAGPQSLAAPTPAGGVLVKAPKPGQDRRVDLPTIGPGTIKRAAQAGLSGIAVAAGGVIVLDPEECAARAEANGMWVQVI